jgi:hypothetical protein
MSSMLKIAAVLAATSAMLIPGPPAGQRGDPPRALCSRYARTLRSSRGA